MGKPGATGMAAALCVALTLATARADDGDSGDLRSMPPATPSWWSGMFASKEAAAPPKKLPPAEAPPPPPQVVTSNPAMVLEREQAAFIRRTQVCDELLEIAERKGDEALREQVYQLMDKAWAVYQQRTAGSAARSGDAAALIRPVQPAPDPARRATAPDAAPWIQRGE
jgi:hypothetical protein